jgi:SAM-dependent methyltransferase
MLAETMTMTASTFPQRGGSAAAAAWDAAAAGWNGQAPQIRAWLSEATAAMLDMADIRPAMRVLDLAAGAGDQSGDIARRVGPGGAVLATDISPRMLEAAAASLRAAHLTNVRTLLADGEALGLDDANFDAAACRLGLMFLDDPLRGLQTVRRALRPGGRFCAMVFSEPSTNPCIGLTVSIARRHAGLPMGDPYRPGSLMSLGKPGLIEALFRTAGFVDVEVRRVSAPFRLASVEAYLQFIRTAAGPVMAILDAIDEPARRAAWAEITEALSPFTGAAGWEAPTELLLAAGAR